MHNDNSSCTTFINIVVRSVELAMYSLDVYISCCDDALSPVEWVYSPAQHDVVEFYFRQIGEVFPRHTCSHTYVVLIFIIIEVFDVEHSCYCHHGE